MLSYVLPEFLSEINRIEIVYDENNFYAKIYYKEDECILYKFPEMTSIMKHREPEKLKISFVVYDVPSLETFIEYYKENMR